MLTYMETESVTTNKQRQNQYLQARVRTNRLVQKQNAHLDLIRTKRAFRNSKHTVRVFICASGQLSPEPAPQLALAPEQNPFWSWGLCVQ